MFTRVKAIVWLHLTRLYRYKLSFVGLVLSNLMWVLLYVLGMLLFISPGQFNEAVKASFWSIVGWILLSNFSSLVGGWTNFFISLHMVEEHLLRDTSPFSVLLGRGVTAIIMAAASATFMGLVFGALFSVNVLEVYSPLLFSAGMVMLTVQALSYGIIIAALSMRTSISYGFLEIASFVMVGLFIVPVQVIPEGGRLLFLSVPFVSPVHLLKVAAGAASGYMTVGIMISLFESLLLPLISLLVTRRTLREIMIKGVRAVGEW